MDDEEFNKRFIKLAKFFKISNNDLTDILCNTNSFICGGSALSLFLDIHPSRFVFNGKCQDIDIFTILPDKKDESKKYIHLNLDYSLEDKVSFSNDLVIHSYIETIMNKNNYAVKESRLWIDYHDEIKYKSNVASYFIKNITTYRYKKKTI